MHERPSVSAEEIEQNLYEDTLDNHFMAIQTRKAEMEIGWFVSSPGMLVGSLNRIHDEITKSDERFTTGAKLKGSVRKLNTSTLIVAQSIHLPADMSDDGIDAYFEDYGRTPELRRVFGYTALNEPGIPVLRSIKTEVSGYLETTNTAADLAIEGLLTYLNNPTELDNIQDNDQIEEDIRRSYRRLDAHRSRMHDRLHEIFSDRYRKRRQ